MRLKISLALAGISIALLVIYGADTIVGGGTAGDGFLPLDAMTRGIGLGTPPIILSIVSFFISKKESSKLLGAMIIITGVLIIIGGLVSLASSGTIENPERRMSEGAGLIAIGGFIAALGAIKIRK